MSRRPRRGHGRSSRPDRGARGDGRRGHQTGRGRVGLPAPGDPRPSAPVSPPPPTLDVPPTVRQPTIAAATPRPPTASDDRVGLPPATPAEDTAAPTNGHAAATNGRAEGERPGGGATAPQLRRFIKSRAYVPMHELRRRFGINGPEDDVTAVEVDGGCVWIGLPNREGALLGELLRGGEVGFELSLDPRSPVVIGVYPMRPVPRH